MNSFLEHQSHTPWSRDALTRLDQAVDHILTNHPNGLSLYELIKQLAQPPHAVLDERPLSGSTALFETNFVVMNSLYRQQTTRQDARYEISSLKVCKTPMTAKDRTETQLSQVDELAAYYLDWQNFNQTEEDIEALLNSFWERMLLVNFEDSDLATLGLVHPVTVAEIKQRYRQLSQQHHPDKGGDADRFVEIQQAYQRLTGG
jgi:hypothetical protein